MTLVPGDTPVTRPELFTVATAGVAEVQEGVVVVAVDVPPVSCVVDPTQTLLIPEMALTVTVTLF